MFWFKIPKSFILSSKYTQEENSELEKLLSDWFIHGSDRTYTQADIQRMADGLYEEDFTKRVFDIYSIMYGNGNKYHPNVNFTGNEHQYALGKMFTYVATGAANESIVLYVIIDMLDTVHRLWLVSYTWQNLGFLSKKK